jgi:hypothetical protein
MIATRVLKLQLEHDACDVPIRIFAPQDRDGSWSCRYEIDWPDGRHTMEVFGVDSIQAILLAFQMIGAELYTSEYHKSGQLIFHEPGQGYGFPVAASIRDLLIGNDRKYGA